MAVADLTNSSLRLIFQDGFDLESGNPIYKSKSFNNVKVGATADQLYEVANAFVGLQQLPLFNIERRDTTNIRSGN